MSAALIRGTIVDMIRTKRAFGRTSDFTLFISLEVEMDLVEEILECRTTYGDLVYQNVLVNGVRETFPKFFGFHVMYGGKIFELVENS